MTRAYRDIYGERHEILLLRDVASYTLLACGFIYVLSVSQMHTIKKSSEFRGMIVFCRLHVIEKRS